MNLPRTTPVVLLLEDIIIDLESTVELNTRLAIKGTDRVKKGHPLSPDVNALNGYITADKNLIEALLAARRVYGEAITAVSTAYKAARAAQAERN